MNPFVEYFRIHSDVTEPGSHAGALRNLPEDVDELCRIVQGLVIHPAWLRQYGADIPTERVMAEQQARTTEQILDGVMALDGRPLTDARSPELRAVGTSRNHALLLCSFLRSRGVAARVRSGFAPYVREGWYEDHWICEYWSENDGYWVRVDSQLDAVQQAELAIDFDPLDIPIDAYSYAGEVWVMYRRERVDPGRCGLLDFTGPGFIKAGIVRDILALNRVEAMPWDLGWGLLENHSPGEVERDELGYVDRLARCSANSLVHLAHSFFKDDPRIRLPENWDLSMAPGLEQWMSAIRRSGD